MRFGNTISSLLNGLIEFSELLSKAIGGNTYTSPGFDTLEKWGGGNKYTTSYGRFMEIGPCGKKIKFWVGLGIKNNRVVSFVIQFKPLSISFNQTETIEELLDQSEFANFLKKEDITILQKFIVNTITEKVQEFREEEAQE